MVAFGECAITLVRFVCCPTSVRTGDDAIYRNGKYFVPELCNDVTNLANGSGSLQKLRTDATCRVFRTRGATSSSVLLAVFSN